MDKSHVTFQGRDIAVCDEEPDDRREVIRMSLPTDDGNLQMQKPPRTEDEKRACSLDRFYDGLPLIDLVVHTSTKIVVSDLTNSYEIIGYETTAVIR